MYFSKFPVESYPSNIGENTKYVLARNILRRVALSDNTLGSNGAFIEYHIKDGEKPEHIADRVYGNPEEHWIILLTNNIIDPYYDWYLTHDQLKSYIVSKYGSLAIAQTRIHHYETIWIGEDETITTSAYQALTANTTANVKKYWEPNVDEYNKIISYKRKKLSLITTTNQVISLPIANTNGTFTIGEDLYQQDNGVVTSSGSILTANSSIITAQHITGTFITTRTIIGADSSANTTLTASSTLLKQNIPSIELSYWYPVSFYDYEDELNESRKEIKLIDSQYASMAENNLISLMG